jgi:uncharacterized membrane protein
MQNIFDCSEYIVFLVRCVAGGIAGALVGLVFVSTGVFHHVLVTIMVFMWLGTIAGITIGLYQLKSRPALSPSTKTVIRFSFAALLIVTALADALPFLVHGSFSWHLVSPAIGILIGIALLIPISRLRSIKSLWIIATVIAFMLTIWIFANDYETTNLIEMGTMAAIFVVVFIWSIVRRRTHSRSVAN